MYNREKLLPLYDPLNNSYNVESLLTNFGNLFYIIVPCTWYHSRLSKVRDTWKQRRVDT